jgi:hypothetical protein
MATRSERYLANAERCQQCSDTAYTAGTKHLFAELANQWLRLAEQAHRTTPTLISLSEGCRWREGRPQQESSSLQATEASTTTSPPRA